MVCCLTAPNHYMTRWLIKFIKSKLIYNSTRFVEWHIINSLAPGICGNNFERIICKLIIHVPWWRHRMETFTALLALCAGNSLPTGIFPSPKPVTRNFSVLFDVRPNKRLCKQSRRRCSETPSRSLWFYCNDRILVEALFIKFLSNKCRKTSQMTAMHTLELPHHFARPLCCVPVATIVMFQWSGNQLGTSLLHGWLNYLPQIRTVKMFIKMRECVTEWPGPESMVTMSRPWSRCWQFLGVVLCRAINTRCPNP